MAKNTGLFGRIGQALDGLTLNNPNEETFGLTPDRLSVAGSSGFTNVSQMSVSDVSVGRVVAENFKSAVDVAGTKDTFVEKFYYLASARWNHTEDYLTTLLDVDVADRLIDAELGPSGMIKFHRYGRFGIDAMVQVNCTNFMQGVLGVFLYPGDLDHASLCGFLTFPSGIINCCVNNTVRIKVPFVYSRGMYDFRVPIYDIWRLRVIILSPLNFATGTTTEATVTVLARFDDLEMHGPSPLATMMRNEVRLSPTSYAINLSNQQDARAKISFALANEGSLCEPGVAGGMRLKNFREWCSVPGYAWHTPFFAEKDVGFRIASIPVTPYWYKESYYETSVKKDGTTPLASIAQMFSYWRGDIVMMFQVACTAFHSGRLMLSFVPGNEDEGAKARAVSMRAATNCLSTVFDIRGTESTCVFRIPWVSDTPMRWNPNYATKQTGQFSSIGHVNVYVYNRLTSPQSVAQQADLLVWICADNIEFFAPIYTKSALTNTGEGRNFDTSSETNTDQMTATAPQDAGPMVEIPTGSSTCVEDPILMQKKPETFEQLEPGVPRHTRDHMDILNFMGRAHFFSGWQFNHDKTVVTIPLNFRTFSNLNKLMPSTLMWMNSLYQLIRGPIDLTFVFTGSHDIDCDIWFTPWGMHRQGNVWTEEAATETTDYKSSLGSIRFNTARTNCLQVRVPYYNALSAVTPHSGSHELDCCYGSITMQVGNYNSRDEYIGVLMYISFCEQTEVYFKRAPINNTDLIATNSTWEFVTADESLMEANLPIEEPADVEFNARVDLESRKPYQPLRMEVGRMRILHAREELKRWKKGEKSKSLSDLMFTQAGLVNYSVAKKSVGNIVMFGVVKDDLILHVQAPQTKFAFWNKGSFVLTNLEGWVPTTKMLDEKTVEKFLCLPFKDMRFDYGLFNKGEFSSAFAKEEFEVMKTFVGVDLSNFLGSLRHCEKSLVERVLGAKIDVTQDKMNELLEEGKEFLSKVHHAVSSLCNAISKSKAGFVLKVVTSIAKAALTIYTCHACEWKPRVLGPLSAVLALELVSTGVDVTEFVISRLLNELCDSGVEKSCSGEILRNLVAGITIFRSVKDVFLWLVTKIRDWYDKKYGGKIKKLKYLEEKSDEIEGLMEMASEFVVTKQSDDAKQEEYDLGVDLLRKLRLVYSMVLSEEDLKRFALPLRDQIGLVSRKLASFPSFDNPAVTRSEPIVCYFYGDRGGGKSLTAMALATKICVAFGLDPSRNIYSKPFGAQYWDGYTGQLVCICDDIGQTTDDEDWKGFCQMVSTAPLRLNMADLSEKGTHFKSPFVICTSNLASPKPRTIYLPAAIERRLHYKVFVEPTSDCCKHVGDGCYLDVKVAKEKGKISDMSCVQLSIGGDILTLDELVDAMVQTHTGRHKDAEDFIKLWSQSGEISNRVPSVLRMNNLWNFVKNHKYVVMGSVLSVLVGVGAIFGLYKLCKRKKSDFEAESAYESRKRPVVKLGEPKFESQSVLDKSTLIKRNLCRFGISEDGERINWVVNAFGTHGEWTLVPSHAYKFNPNVKFFYLDKGGAIYSMEREKTIIFEFGTEFNDVVAIKWSGIPKFKDVREHFVSKGDLDKCSDVHATLCTNNLGMYQLISEGPVSYCESACYRHVDPVTGKEFELYVPGVFRGRGDAAAGSCGGILVSVKNSLQTPFIGMHVAAGNGFLLSKVIYREMFDELETMKSQSSRILMACEIDNPRPLPSRTSFVKTPLFDSVAKDSRKCPALLPYRGEVDVTAIMLSKFSTPIIEEPVGFDKAIAYVITRLLKVVDLGDRFLSVREAICGIEGLDGIDMNTSPGLPYVEYGLRKKDLIDKEQGLVLSTRLEERMNNHLTLLPKGVPLDVTFMTCPKDELRDLDKVQAGKTRSIEAAPLDFVIVNRRLWGLIASKLQSNPGLRSGVAVGMDPESDWHQLYSDMLRFGDNAIDLDYANFDASLSPFMVNSGIEVISFLSGMDENSIRSLQLTISVSRRQFGNLRYIVNGSMPSGTVCTSVLNSVINLILIFYMLKNLYKTSYFNIEDHFKPITYGDDVVIVCKRGMQNLDVLCLELTKMAEFLGLKITSSDKGPVVVKPVLETIFLKRGVRLVLDRFRPTMSKKTIWSLLAWKRKNARLQDNVNDACWFMAQYGEEEYQKFYEVLIYMVRGTALRVNIPTWKEMYLRLVDVEVGRLLN